METFNLKQFTDEWYGNNNAFPTIFEIEETTGCSINVLQENLNFVPKIILDIKTELTHFFNSYNIHFSVVSADETTKVYPAYKGICLHLIGKAEGEAINIKIMPSGKSLMIKMDAVNLAEINPLLKKPFKKFIKKNASYYLMKIQKWFSAIQQLFHIHPMKGIPIPFCHIIVLESISMNLTPKISWKIWKMLSALFFVQKNYIIICRC